MSEAPRWRRYLRFWGTDPAADVEDELSFHIEERTRLNIARGLAPDAARAEAERQFGDVARIRGECVAQAKPARRRARIGDQVGDVARDVRIACRALRRAPVFTLTAGLALALGIGANTAVFTVVNAVLLEPLPYPRPDRVVVVHNRWEGAETANLSPAEYLDYAEATPAFAALGVYAHSSANVVEGDVAERVTSIYATPSTFAALAVAPARGRLFTDADVTAGGTPVVVLSHEYWQSRFAGDARLIGRGLLVNGVTRTVIGVLPAGARLPASFGSDVPPAVFMPEHIDRAGNPPRGSHYLSAVARLAPGWSVATAGAALRRVALDLRTRYPDEYPDALRFDAYVTPVHEAVVGDTRRLLLVFSAAVALVLLIACANVSALVLTRTEDRRREFAVRSAIGGGRWRIARQLLIEHAVLAVVAGAAGAVLALLGTKALVLLQPGDIPRLASARVDGRALAFTLLVSLVATLLVALAPLRFGSRAHDALREAGGRTTASHASQRVRAVLIAGEVAVSIVLLAAAGLLLRSFTNMMGVDPGYRTEQLLTVPISLPPASYPDSDTRRAFYARLVAEATDLPGVHAAGAVSNLPLASGVFDLDIELPARTQAAGDVAPQLNWQIVTPGWLEAMDIDIVRGRALATSDDARAPGAVVLSEAAARKYWGDTDAVGERFRLGAGAGPGWVTVVGIARDVRHATMATTRAAGLIDPQPPPIMYLPHAQFSFWHGGSAPAAMTLVLHTAGEPLTLLQPLRELVRRMDPHVPLGFARTMEQVADQAVAEPRFATSVLGGFALLALVLAVIGVYGLVSFSVARRTREIALRMVLGAHPGRVIRHSVLHGLRPVAIGIALGAICTFLLMRVLNTMLYGVTPHDPLTLLGTVLLLGTTAAAAALLPAQRAARVTPMDALREE